MADITKTSKAKLSSMTNYYVIGQGKTSTSNNPEKSSISGMSNMMASIVETNKGKRS